MATPTSGSKKDKKRCCSFCGKSEYEVRSLIVQDDASICEACVGICSKIIAQKNLEQVQEDEHPLVSRRDLVDGTRDTTNKKD